MPHSHPPLTLTHPRAFILQFPLCLLSALLVHLILHLPSPAQTQSNWLSKLRQIDFLGAFTLVLSILSLILGLDLGSNTSWTSPLTLTFVLLTLPLLTLFLLIETHYATHPLAPLHLITTRALLPSYLCNFFTIAAHMCSTFYIPLYLQAVSHLSATSAGLRFIPIMVLSVLGSLFGGKVMQRSGHYYMLTIACLSASVVGGVLVFLSSGLLLSSSTSIILGFSISAFGNGAVITTTLIAVLSNVSVADQAIATACTYLFRSLGSVVGVSLGASIVQQELRASLRARLHSGREAERIVEGVRQSLEFIEGLEPGVRKVVRGCYQEATNAAFGLSVVLLSCSLVCACFIREKKLSR